MSKAKEFKMSAFLGSSKAFRLDRTAELEQEKEALMAQVAEMREVIGIYLVSHEGTLNTNLMFEATLNKSPAQSLDSLKSAVEQETIYYVVNFLRGLDEDGLIPVRIEDGLRAIRNIPRKYPSGEK